MSYLTIADAEQYVAETAPTQAILVARHGCEDGVQVVIITVEDPEHGRGEWTVWREPDGTIYGEW